MNLHYMILIWALLIGAVAAATGGLPDALFIEGEPGDGVLFPANATSCAGAVQENLTETPEFHRQIGEWRFTMTAVARYTLCGKLVGRDNYTGPPPDTISPMDLSVAWGKLIEEPYEAHITYYKEPRHLNYHFHFPEGIPPLDYAYINGHSSNNHCIFANESVHEAADELLVGDFVRLGGYLVDVRGEDAGGATYTWTTSRSRDDEREGACEIVWVEEVVVIDPSR